MAGSKVPSVLTPSLLLFRFC